MILSSCGLYNYPYLNAPNVDTVIGSGSAEIYNRTDNDPDVFRGYELYYKYYDNSTSIASDDKTIFQTAEPEPADLTKVGYSRVNTVLLSEDNTSYPMIPVDYSDRATAFTLKVNLSQVTSNVPPKVEYSGYTDVTLYREETEYDNTGTGKMEYETFIPHDHEAVEDDGSEVDRTDDKKTLSLYVFSYGKDDKVYNIYSKPVWLGYINY